MAKKSTRPKTQDHQEAKPPSIEDAREALLLATSSWLFYVSDHPVTSYERNLEWFLKHVEVLHELESHWHRLLWADINSGNPSDAVLRPFSDAPQRPFDPVLDIHSGIHEETAIDVVMAIASSIRQIETKAKDRDSIIEAITRKGLPSNEIETKALLSKITRAMKTPETDEKYPGLKSVYLEMYSKGHTWNEIAERYIRKHHGRGVKGQAELIPQIEEHMRYNVKKNRWPRKATPK